MSSQLPRAVLGLGLSLSVMTGCGVMAATPDAPPAPVVPLDANGERLINALQYKQALGNLALHQAYTFTTTQTDETVDLYNFSPRAVDTHRVQEMVMYFDRLESQAANNWRLRRIPVQLDESSATAVNTHEIHRSAARHEFILVPPGTALPPDFTPMQVGDAPLDGVTGFEPNQTTSIIVEGRSGSKLREPFVAADAALPTEICQAMVAVQAVEPAPLFDAVTDNQLSQETVCNGLGDAMLAAAGGISYGQHAGRESTLRGYVSYQGQSRIIDGYVPTQSEYDRLATIMQR